jgi:uncharacterized membrane-anchored protein YitT (DUF2179 family)
MAGPSVLVLGGGTMTATTVDLPAQGHRHTWIEDLQALFTGALAVAIGVKILASAGIMTGGMAGLALLISYATPVSFGVAFFTLNAPFYLLALFRRDWRICVNTLVAAALLSWMTNHLGDYITFSDVNPAFAAVAGGLLSGLGMLALFRHHTTLGGVGILAQMLQERFGLRAGYVQLSVDAVILTSGLLLLSPTKVALSALGALVLNLVIALNHRPGRYLGRSR